MFRLGISLAFAVFTPAAIGADWVLLNKAQKLYVDVDSVEYMDEFGGDFTIWLKAEHPKTEWVFQYAFGCKEKQYFTSQAIIRDNKTGAALEHHDFKNKIKVMSIPPESYVEAIRNIYCLR